MHLLCMVACDFISALGKQRQAELCAFETNMVYISSYQSSKDYIARSCPEMGGSHRGVKDVEEIYIFIC